jgi:hypothetical protein
MCDLTLLQLENSHHSALCDNFRFEVIWHRQSLAALVSCWRPAESNIPVTPSVTCGLRLRWCYNHGNDVVSPSTALASCQKE